MDDKQEQEVKLEIQMDEQVAGGQYINMAVVNHNDSEFVIDCIYVQPQAPKARVKTRLITSPRHAKRLLAVLKQHVASYEQTFGPIDSVQAATADHGESGLH
jgi:hypothetical protein